MSGPLVSTAATVQCAHGGRARASTPASRVLVDGTPAVLATAPWTVAGCPLPPQGGGPCTTAVWTATSLRVTSLGQPLVLATGAATCVPTGAPLTVPAVQSRVMGS